MKRLCILLTLISLAFTAWGDDTVTRLANGHVSIASRGRDVRQVVHELFMQVNKNYVLDRDVKGDLYLALSDVEFDEALEIVCHNAHLKYQTRNGIFYVGMDTSKPTAAPKPETPKPQPKPAGKGKKAAVKQPNTPALSHMITGNYNKKEVREILNDLGRQAGTTIVVADDIPKRFVDVSFGKTSLKYALSILMPPLKLKYEVRSDGTLYVVPVASVTGTNRTGQ